MSRRRIDLIKARIEELRYSIATTKGRILALEGAIATLERGLKEEC